MPARRMIVLLLLTLAPISPNMPPMTRATICSSQLGWCPLDPNLRVTAGLPCQCFAQSGQSVPGVTRAFSYWLYQRPVSLYLNPHWTDMPPPPPVIK